MILFLRFLVLYLILELKILIRLFLIKRWRLVILVVEASLVLINEVIKVTRFLLINSESFKILALIVILIFPSIMSFLKCSLFWSCALIIKLLLLLVIWLISICILISISHHLIWELVLAYILHFIIKISIKKISK